MQLIGSARMSGGTRIRIEVGAAETSRSPILRLNGSLGFAELHISPSESLYLRVCGRSFGLNF